MHPPSMSQNMLEETVALDKMQLPQKQMDMICLYTPHHQLYFPEGCLKQI